MLSSMYQKWLDKEREWIGEYCASTKKSMILKWIPLTLIGTAVLLGGISFLGSGSTEDLLTGVFGGLLFGGIICIFFLLILFINLRPNRYVRKIEHSVEELSINEAEKEMLGKEMLEAFEHEEQTLSYRNNGPKSNNTPARVVRTPHYFAQIGSAPYSTLVRISDIANIKADSEKKIATTRSGNIKTYHHFTLYTIGFYRKDRFERGLADSKLPDCGMGFFSKELRDKALEMFQNEIKAI